MDLKIYGNSVLPISFISKYMSHQRMLLDGLKIRPHLECNSRVAVSILVVLPGGLHSHFSFETRMMSVILQRYIFHLKLP